MPVMPAEAFVTGPLSLSTAHQALPWLILTVALGISALIGRYSLPRSWRRVREISPEQVLDHKPSEEPVGPRMLCRHAKSVTDYKEFPRRSHYTIGQDGWEEVADYALDWATEQAAARTRA